MLCLLEKMKPTSKYAPMLVAAVIDAFMLVKKGKTSEIAIPTGRAAVMSESATP